MTHAAERTGNGPEPACSAAPKRLRSARCRQWIALMTALPFMAAAATTVTVKVTVVAPPPCTINDDRPITVEFGEVMTTKVDGENYKMPVNYTLSCTDASSNAMTLTITGAAMATDGTALQTNKTGLGVRLLTGSSPYVINSKVSFTYPDKPALYAVPIQQSGATLTGGEFSAAATMNVTYQ